MDVMLEFFLIRQSVVARAHLPSVECVDHYLTVPGFVISLNRDVAIQKFLTWDGLNAQPKWDGYVFNGWHHLVAGSSDIMWQRENEGEREGGEHAANKDAVAEGYC